MTTAVVVVVCLLLAAAVVAWPVRRVRSRLRSALPVGPRTPRDGVPRQRRGVARVRPHRPGAFLRRVVTLGRRMALSPPAALRRRAMVPALTVLAAVVIAGAAGGVVAALVVAAYGAVAARAQLAGAANRGRADRRRELLDRIASASSDLRAGLPAGTALPVDPTAGAHTVDLADPLRARVSAATGLAERTGAPLAEVLDRIGADARAADRARASAAAQAAGARATAWLLAALPAGGLVLGYLIGADPLAVLLYTPVGAACALAAVALQLAGLAWTRRILRAAGAVS